MFSWRRLAAGEHVQVARVAGADGGAAAARLVLASTRRPLPQLPVSPVQVRTEITQYRVLVCSAHPKICRRSWVLRSCYSSDKLEPMYNAHPFSAISADLTLANTLVLCVSQSRFHWMSLL